MRTNTLLLAEDGTRYSYTMIRQIRGTVAKAEAGRVVIDVGGVGYLVHTTVPGNGWTQGKEVLFHTYLAVRENALDLYGFTDEDDLRMFALLIDLPKIGPKSALQILTAADTALLQKAVASGDAVYLSKMSGIGKKTAEKIVLGLKDKMHSFGENSSNTAGSDVIDALVVLGYSQKDAREAVQKLPAGLDDTRAQIKEALRILSS